mmetsp:Transcript_81940/g.196461  ORF Transcript_81940/g.196461 Transcript_81940/m.196461 type:complete len:542 (+) Transcript_81940:350-1975(+)
MANLHLAPQALVCPLQGAILLGRLLDGLLQLLQISLPLHDLLLRVAVGLGAELQVIPERLQLPLHVRRVRGLLGFLGLGLQLQRDGIALEDGPLHLHDHLLLAALQLLQPQLHAVDLLLHGRGVGLTHVGIQSRLHLLLEGDLSLPKENLALRLQDVLVHLVLVHPHPVYIPLHVQALCLDLLELLDELRLHHGVGVGDLVRPCLVLHHGAVHAVHVEAEVLHVILQLPDLLLMARQLALDPELLLLQDHLLILVLVEHPLQLVRVTRHGQKLRLLLDPVLLHVGALLRQLRNGLPHVLQLGLLRPGHVLVVADLRLQLRPLLIVLSVQAVDKELLLLNLVVSLPNLLFVLLDELLALRQLIAELLVAILEHLIVRLGVEAVHRDTGDLVEKVLRLHLLCRDLFPNLFHSFSAIGSHPVARRLLAHLLLDLAHDHCDVPRDLLHVPLQDLHLPGLIGDGALQALRLCGVLVHALVERSVLGHEFLSLLLQIRHLRLQSLHLLLVAVPQGAQLLMPLLLGADGRVQAADLVLDGELRLALLL